MPDKDVAPIPREELDAVAARLRARIVGELQRVFDQRVREHGLTHLALARRCGMTTAEVVRFLSDGCCLTLRNMVYLAYGMGVEIKFDLIKREDLEHEHD
jgi:hypothetical protein